MPVLHPSTLAALQRAFDADHPEAMVRHLLRLARQGYKDLLRLFAGHPLEDEFLDMACTRLKTYWEQAHGTVYIAANPSQQGFYKVGKTRLSGEDRIRALNNEAVVGQFLLVKELAVHDRHFIERAAHRRLRQYPCHKEFVHASWREVYRAVDEVIAEDLACLSAAGLSFTLPAPADTFPSTEPDSPASVFSSKESAMTQHFASNESSVAPVSKVLLFPGPAVGECVRAAERPSASEQVCPGCGRMVNERNPSPCQQERCDAWKVLSSL